MACHVSTCMARGEGYKYGVGAIRRSREQQEGKGRKKRRGKERKEIEEKKREKEGEERERKKEKKESGVPTVGTRRTKKQSLYIRRGLHSKR